MGLTAFFFYLFSALAVLSAAMVVVARNPVHAVLFLILAFFNAAGLFVLLGAEFLAVVYKDEEEGETSYQFMMTVLKEDIMGG